MYAIEKIKIIEPESAARQIVSRLPRIDITPDSDGNFYEEADFDITLDDGLDVTGKLLRYGNLRTCSGDYLTPPASDIEEESEIQGIMFWIDGDDIEVENEDDLMDWINRLL